MKKHLKYSTVAVIFVVAAVIAERAEAVADWGERKLMDMDVWND